ncbi:glycosyl transferase, partial [Lasius niger]
MEGRNIIEIDLESEEDVVIIESEEEEPANGEDGIMVIDGYDDFEPAEDMVAKDSDEEDTIIDVAPADVNNDMAIANSDDEFDNMMAYVEHSDYNSSCSEEEITHSRVHRDVGPLELRSLHELHKMCAIYFFYESGDHKFCTPCFFGGQNHTEICEFVLSVYTKRLYTDLLS